MDLSQTINTLSDAHLLDICERYITKWNFDVEWVSLNENIQKIFNVTSDSEYEEHFEKTNKTLIMLAGELQKRHLIDTGEHVQMLVRFNLLLEKVHYAQTTLNQYLQYKRTTENGHDYNANIDATIFKFKALVFEDMKPFQKIIYKLFSFFGDNNYRKSGEFVYEEIANTRAWRQKCTIVEMINSQCHMTRNLDNWFLVTTTRDMDKNLTDYFMRSTDDRFKTLEKNRNVFSFKNGIYFSNSEEAIGVHETQTQYTDKFIEYTSSEYKKLCTSVTACKYFDQEFVNDATKIETPFLDSIYEYQGLSAEVIEINKMFLGRMLYNVGQLDNWQVILMLLGSGGSGKSTITNIVRLFYESDDVGIMGNNFSKTFGLADIYDKFSFVAPEVKRDWGIDQAEFQEMVSGGKINVNIKHQPSKRVEWKAPGMMAGNENPGFVDNACSIQRRVVVTRFDTKVDNVDPNLGNRLEVEIGSIIKQCNTIYLKYVNLYAYKDIWKWLPTYFNETQNLMASASNALHAFLDSDILEFGEDKYTPMDEFWKRFNIFCVENNNNKPKINVDFYRSPFAKYKIKVENKGNRKYPADCGRMYKNANFLIGVDLKQDDTDDERNAYVGF